MTERSISTQDGTGGTLHSMQRTPQNSVVLIVGLVVAVVVIVIQAAVILSLTQQIAMLKAGLAIGHEPLEFAPETSDTAEQQPVESTSTGKYAYELQVTAKPGNEIGQVEASLALTDTFGGTDINLAHGMDKYDRTGTLPLFYLTDVKLEPQAPFAAEQFSGVVVAERPELVPYLDDRKYCEKDTDCASTSNFCKVGAYNQYLPFRVYGCGFASSIEGYSEADIAALNCPISEISGEPAVSAAFTTAQCIENVCTATDMQVQCAQ